MDYVKMVAEMYRKRIADGMPVNQARYFDFTHFQGVEYIELQKMRKYLKENGYIEQSYKMGFLISKAVAESFED